jgi:hypothetical protein
MSRSQGAANNGWPTQRHPAGEGDPRTAAQAQRPQPNQQANQYVVPGQQQASGYPQGYGEPQAPAYGGAQQGYHYPQQHPQQPQYAPPPQAPAAHTQPPNNRQGLSSLDSARNAQPTQDFENFPRTQPPQYATQPPRQAAPAQRAPYAVPGSEHAHVNAGYRQAAPQGAPQYARQAPPAYDQKWPPQSPAQTQGYGQDLAGYLPDAPFPANGNQPHVDPLQQADWAMPATSYGDPIDQPEYAQHGYAQAHGGALEPTYNQDEAGAYEAEEPRRVSWTMRIAGAVVVAIGLGYGLAQAYKAVLGSPPDSSPPVIESDASPAKERPLDPGGKQFSHTDSKVLGRLGDNGSPSSEERSAGLSESDTSSNGSRPVKTLVVGRDGSIEAPTGSAEAAPAHEEQVSVPGLTVVDAFGGAGQSAPPQQERAAPQPPQQQAEAEPVVVNTKPRVSVKSTKVIPASTASLPDEAAAPVASAVPKKQKVAAAPVPGDEGASSASGATSASGANGYVVVLASVPASGSSRLDALRKFADLQQQYGTVLANKTPDVRETTLAGKGPYHRLLVGPPGSKSQANELCTQLKASGYKDCWVTAY